MRRRFLLTLPPFAFIGAAFVPGLQAQVAERRPLRLIVPYAAGGLPDTVARILSRQLGAAMGRPVVVDNRGGAGGAVALAALAQAPADGSVFLLTDGPLLATALYVRGERAAEAAALVPVSLVGIAPLYLAVHPQLGATTIEDIVRIARARPGALTYGSSGAGSIHHLTAEAMGKALGIKITHVPFRGSAASVPAMVAGTVDMVFASPPSLAGFVRSGQARLVAVNSASRSAQFPDVPALAERIPGFDFAFTVAVLARRGTAVAEVERIGAHIMDAVRSPHVAEQLLVAGVEARSATPTQAAAALLAERVRIADAASEAGLKRD
jgi:tripartite-type tricarboxylate transporter receptor subunit TctC